jgi:PKHD-type hydroxylase
MSIQLSHFYEYEGGILELDGIDTSNPEFKQKGTAICFPSYHTHRVTPVTKGNRKALVTWCEGPLLR